MRDNKHKLITSFNEFTGAYQQTKPPTSAYDEGLDRIFGKKVAEQVMVDICYGNIRVVCKGCEYCKKEVDNGKT